MNGKKSTGETDPLRFEPVIPEQEYNTSNQHQTTAAVKARPLR